MTSRDFCFWLQGFFELTAEVGMSKEQTEMVKRHLALVFTHEIDPSMGSASHQEQLNVIHAKPPFFTPADPMEHLTKPQDGPIKYRC